MTGAHDDYQSRATLHKPSDPRAAVLELRSKGMSDIEIAATLRIAVEAVHVLIEDEGR